MRDLLYKNLTSDDKRRKVISSSEISDDKGLRSTIHRHFIWLVKEVEADNLQNKPQTSIYVLKEKNNNECKQRFICKLKGGLYVIIKDKTYLVSYVHSVNICLQDLTKFSPKEA